MACSNVRGLHLPGHPQEMVELQVGVAEHARGGGTTGAIIPDKRLYYQILKLPFEVDHIIGDFQA
jgi:hypothetical protein